NFHNVSVSGGSEKLTAYFSGRVYDRQSINNINKDAGIERQNFKSNIVFRPNDWLELSANTQFINERDKDQGGFSNGFGGLWSTTTWYNLMAFYPVSVDGIPSDIGTGTGGHGGNAGLFAGISWRVVTAEVCTNTLRAVAKPVEGLVLNVDYSNRIADAGRTLRFRPFECVKGNRLNYTVDGLDLLTAYRGEDKHKAVIAF